MPAPYYAQLRYADTPVSPTRLPSGTVDSIYTVGQISMQTIREKWTVGASANQQSLKLVGMASAIDELAAQGSPTYQSV